MRVGVAAIAFLAAGAAAAASLDIEGTYGTAAGCKYANDGLYGDDSAAILNAEHYENFATHCDFVQAPLARDGSLIVTMLCGHEGEGYQTIEFMRIVRAEGNDAYELFSQSGDLLGRLDRCG